MSLLQPLLSSFPDSWHDELAEIRERHERHRHERHVSRKAHVPSQHVQQHAPEPAPKVVVRQAPRGAFAAPRISAQSPVAQWGERSSFAYTLPKALPWGVVNDREAWLNLSRPFSELL